MKIMYKEIVSLFLGILCILYGICIMAIGSGTLFYMVWFCGGFCFFVLALVFHFSLWDKLSRLVRGILLIGLTICILCFGIVEIMIAGCFHEKGQANLDYVLVLGAQVYESGPSVVLKYRLDTAAAYLQENENTLCIVCGGQGYNEPGTEAEIMAEYLENAGIDSSRIIIEKESSNTTENIMNAMKKANLTEQTVGIITNDFHLFRALKIADKNGLHAVGIAAPSNAFYLPNNMLREFLGVIKDTLQGNMDLLQRAEN